MNLNELQIFLNIMEPTKIDDLEILGTHWFQNVRRNKFCVGMLKTRDTISNKTNFYMGFAASGTENTDIEFAMREILRYGQKYFQ